MSENVICGPQMFSYDGLGNLKSANYEYGDVTYTYDHLNRVSQVHYPAGTGTDANKVTYQYEKTQSTQRRGISLRNGLQAIP